MRWFLFALWPLLALGTPYPDPGALLPMPRGGKTKAIAPQEDVLPSLSVLRVQVDWLAEGETYQVTKVVRENSGTNGLYASARRPDPYGSYRAELTVGGEVFHDALGTGKEFRLLTRALTFRFPWRAQTGRLKIWAENPESGAMEVVLEQELPTATKSPAGKAEVRTLRAAQSERPVVLSIYAEGYPESRKERFFQRARKVVEDLQAGLPGHERFHVQAVFAPSAVSLGRHQDLGPIPVPRESFLGLYFPHWNQFGRWFHVVYPTDEGHYREALASAPYDHPLVLVDDASYWGVGNYKELTAIPAESSSFTYLLLHEYGHYLGLNEEYEESGRTELEFAPGIPEPWSPNITFHPARGELKWEVLVGEGTPLPTPRGSWGVGAYPGGYAGSAPRGHSHKPVLRCTMNTGGPFCPVCERAIRAQLAKDAGE